jgi:hypothetical protein
MRAFYLLFTSFLFVVAGGAQTTVTIVADKDNTIFSNDLNASNGAGDGFFAGVNSAGEIRRGLVHFNLSTLPPNAVITAATLRLNVIRVAANTNGLAAHKLTADWGEGTSVATGSNEGQGTQATANDATWDKRFYPSVNWSTVGGDFTAATSASVATASIGAVNLTGSTVLSDVQGWYSNPATNFGWIIRGTNESGSRNAVKIASKENTSASQRPSLIITYTTTVPVTLKSFSASLRSKDALVQWSTATEINNDYFEIQHSNNGLVFTTVGKVSGNGNSTLQHSYSFVHTNPTGIKHYYRLAQHDINGGSRYSQVVVLSGKSGIQLQVQPNPVTSLLTVTSSTSLHTAKYQIVSASGQTLMQGSFDNQQLNVQQLKQGQYWLNIQAADGECTRTSFIKN